jgi:PAS domain-containing protein
VSSLIPEPELVLLREAVRRHVEHDVPLDIELPFRAEARGIRWFRLRGRAVRDDDGRAMLLAGSLSDVTESRSRAGGGRDRAPGAW